MDKIWKVHIDGGFDEKEWEVEHGIKVDDEIRKRVCTRCEKHYRKIESPVMYVALHCGQVRWWHKSLGKGSSHIKCPKR